MEKKRKLLENQECIDNFRTPKRRSLRNKIIQEKDCQPTNSRSATPLLIPPSPGMKKLGFGTGVKVYLIERYSPLRGCYKSPWAIKKLNKELKPNHEFSLRLKQEAKVLKSLNHPNIIGFRSYTKNEEGSQCLVMEAGETSLTSFIEKAAENNSGPLLSKHILKVVESVASALNYLHTEKHILHGDLKSANILVKGNFKTVKLCDFGVSLKLRKDLTIDPMKDFYVGTECWSAPEGLIGGTVSNKTDIFSLGLVIWEMIALAAPHIDKLDAESLDNSFLGEEEKEKIEAEVEEKFQEVLGTRPSLPDSCSLDDTYNEVMELFYICTEEDPEKRPSAKDILDSFFSKSNKKIIL